MWKTILNTATALWGRLFLNPGSAKLGIFGFVLLLVFAFASKCHAGESELYLEAGSTIVRAKAPVLGMALRFPEAGPADIDYLVSLHLLGAADGMRNNGALSFMLVDGFGRFDIGFGVCLLHHTDAIQGSVVNFALSVGYRFGGRGGAVRERHCSTGGMSEVNKGRDFVTYGWAIR